MERVACEALEAELAAVLQACSEAAAAAASAASLDHPPPD